MKVILASSEVVPYSKTGGLADVSGALPKALAHIGCDTSVVTPRYAGYSHHHGDVVGHPTGHQIMTDLVVPFGGGMKYAGVWLDYLDSAPVYFIDYPEYFGRGYIYGYGDFDAERFAFFSRAVVELAKRLGHPPDIIHCNDWQTGFIPAYLKRVYQHDPFFAHTRTLFTIHNLAYQGTFHPELLPHLGFGYDVFEHGMEFYGTACAMKAGIYFSTAISTVSRRYAEETQTPEYGNRLEGLLRARRNDYIGILNGVDYNEWNPATDPHIVAHYNIHDLEGKRECKRDLLRRYYLPDDEANLGRPLLGIVTRLTVQKGIDLIAGAIWRMLDAGVNFVLLGSGGQSYEDFFQHVRDSRHHQVGVYFGYKESLAHQVEAGADMYLMPSAYEPCGLNQMYSLKYGTVPIVRGTGGLDDTIRNFERTTGEGNGFKFYEYSSDRLLEKFYEALLVYYDRETWQKLQRNAMMADHSWDRAAHNYMDAYHQIQQKG
ncbi:MAG TPA: glycogen synthase [Blastocatellia bacterium]|nr:glycogen synthase [Blastocatellia bacterium]